MCTTEYLERRYKQVHALITATVEDAVCVVDDNGGCLPEKMAEIACSIRILNGYNTLLGVLISKIDALPIDEAEAKAKDVISNMIIAQTFLAEMPPVTKPH